MTGIFSGTALCTRGQAIVTVALLSIFLFSCKKDKLIDDKDIFVGKWKLAYIVEVQYGQNSAGTWTSYDTASASSLDDEYYIEFKEKGKVYLSRNDKNLICGRTVFHTFSTFTTSPITNYKYSIRINNNEDKILSGLINRDTLFAKYDGFPYAWQDLSSGGKYYNCVYLK